MAQQAEYFNQDGLNLYINPLSPQGDGYLIRAVNVDSYPYGAKIKRPGYITYLGTPDNSRVDSLFSWTMDSGTQLYTYRQSGSLLYFSQQGTGAWTVAGNGTITPGSQLGYSVLNKTLIVSQNAGTTRHSTDGTTFSDTSGAPAGGYLEQYHNRIYITGTANPVSYSVTGDPTNWNNSGTSDGGVITMPGAGRPNKLFKLADRLFISKEYQQIFRWDDYSLVDMATNNGLSSPYSYGTVGDDAFWLNYQGIYTSNGGVPQIISNPIQRYIYNDPNVGIAGTSFGTAAGEVLNFDYFLAVGSVTDDLTYETVPNAVIKYNYMRNDFHMNSFNDFPTRLYSFKNANSGQQLIFGNATGQCFTYGGTATSDNGTSIESILEYIFHMGAPSFQKEWRTFTGFFNPGCQAQIMYALGDTFLKEEKNWTVLGDAVEGAVRYKFPAGSRSRILYIKIVESSRNTRFSYYGCMLDADPVPLH